MQLEQFFDFEEFEQLFVDELLAFEQLLVDLLPQDLLEFEQSLSTFATLFFSFFRPNIFPPYRKYLSTSLLFVIVVKLYILIWWGQKRTQDVAPCTAHILRAPLSASGQGKRSQVTVASAPIVIFVGQAK